MLGKAAMIAVLLTPTASVARHDEHRTAANPFSWLNVAASSPRRRADCNAPGCCVSALPLHPTRSRQSIPAAGAGDDQRKCLLPVIRYSPPLTLRARRRINSVRSGVPCAWVADFGDDDRALSP